MKDTKTRQARADPTRAKILKHARKLFTQHGFAGTSTTMIATQAKLHRSLIFHHFHNKQNLWLEVKLAIVAQAAKKAVILPDMALAWHDYLRKWIKNNIAFYRNNPDIVAMINWQRTEHATAAYLGHEQSSEAKKWTLPLKHFQAQGAIRKDIDLGFAITLIGSISSTAALDPNAFIKKKKDLDAYVDFCVTLIENGLK
jgi:AcrR family transcriptional regulator